MSPPPISDGGGDHAAAADDQQTGRAVVIEEHIAHRPSWDCRACRKPWPCGPAREALVAELDSVQLAIYAWVNLEEAVGDLPTMPAADAFDRFLGRTRWPNRRSHG